MYFLDGILKKENSRCEYEIELMRQSLASEINMVNSFDQ